jgi:hypothetical protein
MSPELQESLLHRTACIWGGTMQPAYGAAPCSLHMGQYLELAAVEHGVGREVCGESLAEHALCVATQHGGQTRRGQASDEDDELSSEDFLLLSTDVPRYLQARNGSLHQHYLFTWAQSLLRKCWFCPSAYRAMCV